MTTLRIYEIGDGERVERLVFRTVRRVLSKIA